MNQNKETTELVAALHEGVFETPLWATFLYLLRRMTDASYATLVFRPPSRLFKDGLYLFSGDADPAEVENIHKRYIHTLDPSMRVKLVEGLPYSLEKMFAMYVFEQEDLYNELVVSKKITAIRQMYVSEKTGVGAWLTLARQGEDFSARDTALMSAIATTLRQVLRFYIALDQERFAASLASDATRRLQFGWISLDAEGHVIDSDERGTLVLSQSGVLSCGANGTLAAASAEVEREIYLSLQQLARNPQSRSRAITLSRNPWLDMLLVPAQRTSISVKAPPVAIAYVHDDSWQLANCVEQLAELFGLFPREARLALALSRGMSITEAASALGLTSESARTYTKAIYAKTGARGLPDLVRIIMRSVLAVAQDS